jgi:CHAT domain
MKKILILAANPKNTTRLRLDQEVRDIDEGLGRAKHRDQFDLEQRWAVRSRDIQRALLDTEPQIIHFSGHGAGNEGLVFEDEAGQSKTVSGSALSGLFRLFSERVECVILNACYSEVQAEAISKHVPYVIGINQAISDRAAIEFAVGFYDALGAGRSVEFAYNLGCSAIQLAGGDEQLTPTLKKNNALLSETLPLREIISVSSSQTSYEKTSETKWVLVLNATLGDDVSREQLDTVIERLRDLSGDSSLKVEGIESGSITIKLDGSEEGFKVIQTLYKEGKLTELLGLPVKHVGYEDSYSESIGRSSTVDVFFSYSHKDEDLRDELATHRERCKIVG